MLLAIAINDRFYKSPSKLKVGAHAIGQILRQYGHILASKKLKSKKYFSLDADYLHSISKQLETENDHCIPIGFLTKKSYPLVPLACRKGWVTL